ncbi:MAG TPA: aldo/keto reductase [Thermodesulfobacteriota bacterium]|nr:aldo/keto reductase [Thermodesulfobacteriota bacterium]
MRYKLLGRSGLRVSEICLGAMTFGEEWGWGASKEESRKMYEAFREAGGNFIDTANIYTEGTSERYVGEFIASERDQIVLATKYSNSMRRGDVNAGGNHRKSLVQALDASLKRLKTDYVDLYWVHVWDYMTPVEEVMRALDDMVRAGKVLYIAISDAPAWIISQANTIAELKGWTPFVALQVEYSLIERTPERDLVPMARAFDIAILPWSPLGSGVLTGKYSGKQRGDSEGRRLDALKNMLSEEWTASILSERNLSIAEEVTKIADEIGRTPSQVALNWLRQKPGVVIPIIGARKVSHIKDNLGCLDFRLSDEHMKRLDEVSRIDLGFPHDFANSEEIRNITFGGTFSSIDNHRRSSAPSQP